MQISGEINSPKNVHQKGGHVVDIESGIILLGSNDEILGQRQLALAENGIRQCQQFLR